MKFVLRAVQVGFVWLTAVTMLVAGLPHSDCVCPDGTHKPFCFGVCSPRTGCCCGNSCCSSSGGKCCGCKAQHSSSDQQVKHSCCYKNQRQPSTATPSTGIQVKGNCCQKTPAQNKFVGVSPAEENAKQHMKDGFSVPLPPLVLVATEPMAGRSPFPWHRYALPPPPDLVITLQHFLI